MVARTGLRDAPEYRFHAFKPALEGFHVVQRTGDHFALLADRRGQLIGAMRHDAHLFAALQQEAEDLAADPAVRGSNCYHFTCIGG